MLFWSDAFIIGLAKDKLGMYPVPNRKYVVVVDYSKPIDEERLYLVDVIGCKVVMRSVVSHGINSGGKYAVSFGNEEGSLKSSLGCYKTGKVYYGQYGKSLVLYGLDSENSNAKSRHIIFHGNGKMIGKWSWGCFATPDSTNERLIGLIKNGCLVYVRN